MLPKLLFVLSALALAGGSYLGWIAFKRAGATGILTYAAVEAARLLKRG